MKAKVVDDLTLLASIMAATVHDYGHSGVNNDFLNRHSHLFSTLCCANTAVCDLYMVMNCTAVANMKSLQTVHYKLHVGVRQCAPAWCDEAAHVAVSAAPDPSP